VEERPAGIVVLLAWILIQMQNVAFESTQNVESPIIILSVFLILSKQGAATTCFVALHPSLKGVSGKYFLDCNEYQPSAHALNQLLGRNLWDFSNKLLNSLSKA